LQHDVELLQLFELRALDVRGRRHVAHHWRRRPGARASLPVLFTSGYTENAIVHNGRLDSGVQLLQKPYQRRDLALKVRQTIDSAGPGPTGRG
jgi:response regulator RpfG family c-di-GMP phosphodiesterase